MAQESLVDVNRSAADILNPAFNVSENTGIDPRVIPPQSPDDLTAEDYAEAFRKKQEKYDEENAARMVEEADEADDEEEEEVVQKPATKPAPKPTPPPVTTSPIDKGQESHLSPDAQRSLAESQKKSGLFKK